MVLPALRPVPAHCGGDGAVRPLLVQPGGRGTGDGLRHSGAVRDLHESGATFRADAGRLRDPCHQVLVLGVPEGAAHPLRDPSAGPGAPLELSPMDLESLDRWEAYPQAKEEMFRRTEKKVAAWAVNRLN